MRVLIAGCGYVGTALGKRLARAGHTTFGLRREAAGLPAVIHPVPADLTRPETLNSLPEELDAVIYAASPSEHSEAGYRAAYVLGLGHLLAALAHGSSKQARVVFVSSTAVYGQDAGEWVDESSTTAPVSFSGRTLLAAERLALEHSSTAIVLRLGGIYGPGRTRLLEQIRQGRATLSPNQRYTNRIHRDDAASALFHLSTLSRPEAVYLGVDDAPASEREVFSWLAHRMNCPEPVEASTPERATRRASGNKRCSNARLKASGYDFIHPTFREGYAALLEAEHATP